MMALSTEEYRYTLNDGHELIVHTDPAGLWHVGVSATIWDASLILTKHFEMAFQNKNGTITPARKGINFNASALNILELGAGCSGLPSLTLKYLLASIAMPGRIVATDKESALPLLRRSNDSQQANHRVEVESLDWTLDIPIPLIGASWNIIIASDTLAFPSLYRPLVKTLVGLSNTNSIVYIAYERRDFSAEIEFFRLLGEHYRFEMIPEMELDKVWRAPEEIYLYRAWLRQ